MLRVLEDKGYVRHQAEELRYVYVPTVPREKAKRSAVKHLLDTFFKDSPEQIVAALLDVSATRLTRDDRSEEHTSELQSHLNLVCRLLLEKKNKCHTRYT